MSYKYKSADAAVVKAVQDHFTRRAALVAETKKLGELFGGNGITYTSGGTTRAYGVEFPDLPRDNPHWTKPTKENQGYRQLRVNAVMPKGITKEERAEIKAEHARLLELWKTNEPKCVRSDDAWDAVGINRGALWLHGGVMFPHEGAAYFELGLPLEGNGEMPGAVEITSSEYEKAKAAYRAG